MNNGLANADTYDFKRWPFGVQKVTFQEVKGYLLHAKRPPFANLPKTTEDCKENPSECDKP